MDSDASDSTRVDPQRKQRAAQWAYMRASVKASYRPLTRAPSEVTTPGTVEANRLEASLASAYKRKRRLSRGPSRQYKVAA